MKLVLKNSTKTKLFIDIIIFILFITVYEAKATGLFFHEWSGVVMGLIIMVHIVMHWQWIVCMTKNVFGKIKTEPLVKYIIDVLIFIGFTTIIFSGIMISKSLLPSLGLTSSPSHFWHEIHSVAVDTTLFLTAVHFALNWKWIVNNVKRYIIKAKAYKNQLVEDTDCDNVTPKSAYFKVSRIINISGRFLLILTISGFISLGWYCIPQSSDGFENSRGPEHKIEQVNSPNTNNGANNPHNEGRNNHHQHHDESGMFVFEILKNLIIFALVTFVVTFISKRLKSANNAKPLRV